MRFSFCKSLPALLVVTVAIGGRVSAQQPTGRPSVYQTTLEEAGQKTEEITTQELQVILAAGTEPVFDVRTAEEYAIAHIPGSINVYEKEVERIVEQLPNRDAPMILYCNGPSCGKSKRTSEQLVALGYTHVRRYQLGLPVWRALSQTVQTDMPGLVYMYSWDRTAVFVDARTPSEFQSGSIPGAVNVQAGEATAANDDGRLPFRDKGTRVVVFGTTPQQGRIVAAEIAKKAYWNSSFFGGTLTDLLMGGFINHPPVAMARDVTIGAGPSCTALVTAREIDGGSYDLDAGNTLALSVNASDPLPPGRYLVTLTATDNYGSSGSATSEATIADQTPPALSAIVVGRAGHTSSRENRRGMKLVTIGYDVTDNCGAVSTELGVTSNEPGEVSWHVVDAHHVLLKVGGDRNYWITVTATDGAGNQSVRRIKL
jgi:rhodanese-related sulfurtransferase